MLRKSKCWCVAAISLSFSVFGLAPAVAGDCGLYGCGGGYIVQQVPDFSGRAPTYARHGSVVTRYCDGYDGGQNPYASCSVGRPENIASIFPSIFAAAEALGPPPSPPPMVTNYHADKDGTPLVPPVAVAKASAPAPRPIVTKYKADAH